MQENAGILLKAYSDVRNRLAQEVMSESNWESNPPPVLSACSGHIPLWLRAKVLESDKWQIYVLALLLTNCMTVCKCYEVERRNSWPLFIFFYQLFEGVFSPIWDHLIYSSFDKYLLKFYSLSGTAVS